MNFSKSFSGSSTTVLEDTPLASISHNCETRNCFRTSGENNFPLIKISPLTRARLQQPFSNKAIKLKAK